MKTLLGCGIADPSVLFLAVGDAVSDRAPLQVGQFEASEREIDQWLTWTFLEGAGGTFGKESYELAMYFAARHTDMDNFRKRGKRGYYFMTGDEEAYPLVSRRQAQQLIGDDVAADVPIAQVVDELQRTFEPFFLIPDLARRKHCEAFWRKLLGDRVICMEDPTDSVDVAAGLVALCEGALADLDAVARKLTDGGTPRPRVGAVVRALTPFAATLQRDGTPGTPPRRRPHPPGAPHRALTARLPDAAPAPRCFVVVDLAFGDAGKGTVTDWLVRRHAVRTVVRFNGGAQAGHNVVTPDGRHHTFAQFGSGSFVPGVATHFAAPTVFHPTALAVEARYLSRQGLSPTRSTASRSAPRRSSSPPSTPAWDSSASSPAATPDTAPAASASARWSATPSTPQAKPSPRPSSTPPQPSAAPHRGPRSASAPR
jgi:hypothetical protein